MAPTCTQHGTDYPCREPECDGTYKCNGCNWTTTEGQLDDVKASMFATGLDPDNGMMCPDCYIEMVAQF